MDPLSPNAHMRSAKSFRISRELARLQLRHSGELVIWSEFDTAAGRRVFCARSYDKSLWLLLSDDMDRFRAPSGSGDHMSEELDHLREIHPRWRFGFRDQFATSGSGATVYWAKRANVTLEALDTATLGTLVNSEEYEQGWSRS